jgi:hypothetical protein
MALDWTPLHTAETSRPEGQADGALAPALDQSAAGDNSGFAAAASSGPAGTVIANSGGTPYSAVVRIVTTIAGVRYSVSGVLVAPDEVLTAAHVVWSADSFSTAAAVTVSPGQNEGSFPFGTVSVTNFNFNHINDAFGFIAPSQTHSDYALLHLAQPIGFQAGTMVINSSFGGGAAHVSGYTGVSPFDSPELTDLVPVTVTPSLFYGILNFSPTGTYLGQSRQIVGPGSSGGPLWFTDASGAPTWSGWFPPAIYFSWMPRG